MSLLTPITKLAMLGGAGALIYTAATPLISSDAKYLVEEGYVNREHVELYAPVNERGKSELFLKYEDGLITMTLPILTGDSGPIVGDADYHWDSMGIETKSRFIELDWPNMNDGLKSKLMENGWNGLEESVRGRLTEAGWAGLDSEVKSRLVTESWSNLTLESRKSILASDIENLLEKYGA